MSNDDTKMISKVKPWISTLIAVFAFSTPFAISFFVYLSRIETRVSILEKTTITDVSVDQKLRAIIREELKPLLENHENRIRFLEIKIAQHTAVNP